MLGLGGIESPKDYKDSKSKKETFSRSKRKKKSNFLMNMKNMMGKSGMKD
ncbi:MAG TPA: hypothetical protein VKR58_02980 [Aquella sp.]|nr:hypothetical protein [Aquella sp.]